MTTKEMQEAILKWKKEQDCCILAHCYQTHDILEVADFVGDSFGLAQKAAQTNCKRVIRLQDVRWQNSWMWKCCNR